jgi:hypothetical protein
MKFSFTTSNLLPPPSLPEIDSNSTNLQTRCYLSAWQYIHASNTRLLKFSSDRPVCIDTGASCCISNNKDDFITFAPSSSTVLKGISSGLTIAGTGTIKWVFLNDDGDEVTINLHNSLYVPETPMCLLSPQHMAQQTISERDGFNSKGKHGVLTFAGHKRTIHYNSSNNLPIIFLATIFPSSINNNISTNNNPASLLSSTSLDHETPSTLSPSQRKLLNLHYKMGHLNIPQIQQFARDGLFGSHLTSLGNCDAPLCKACLHGKQHRQAITVNSASGTLDISHLEPGDCVSGDQVESTTPGLVPTYRGTPSTDKYHAGTLFVDHASRFLHFTPHLSTGSKEAIMAKHSFEQLAHQHNKSIKCYHTDNGIFASKDFRSSCLQQKQRMKFCGVNAHHQNGIAEHHIRSITEHARTMLIHAMISWPDIITEHLWPYAFRLAVDLYNNTPNSTGLTPEEIFTGLKGHNRLNDLHPFGCPIFVLDPSLQQGHKIPRWKPRSRVGVHLGFSPEHASSVPLVLSTTTGLVSPQFHVVFDDYFSTTNCLRTNVLPSHWSTLLSTSASKFVDNNFDSSPFVDSSWFTDTPPASSTTPVLNDTTSPSSTAQRELATPLLPSQREDVISPHTGWNSTHRYETRFRKKFIAHTCVFDTTTSDTPFDENLYSAFIAVQDSYPIHSGTELSFLEHFSCTAQSNPDVLHYGSMLRDPDRPLFETDMHREISDLLCTGTVEITLRSCVPLGLKILPAIWSFRRKRAPDWSILKHKARVCPHGGHQVEGEHFWETYAPVINWRTVRLVLILSLLADLKSRQIDYVNAYTQAPADCDIFMSIPAGFTVQDNTLNFTGTNIKNDSSDYVLRIKKNMYGLRQAGNNWFDALRSSLLLIGFHQSCHDPCLFIRKVCLLLVYVDDCLLFAKSDTILDEILASLEKTFILTSQGSVGAYLGIDIQRTSDGNMELTQTGLINKIISACGLQDQSTQHNTPAMMILTADSDGPSCEHSWNYRSLIGMLNYLASSTRPDIAFAVHQCARFTTAPKCLHELAIRRIVRYLKATSTKGYILRPSSSYNLDCFVDADFAGTWSASTSEDPSSVKSRTGYVITFASCPVLWCSKMQTEIALSTTEAEYIALSQSACDLLPM